MVDVHSLSLKGQVPRLVDVSLQCPADQPRLPESQQKMDLSAWQQPSLSHWPTEVGVGKWG